MSQKDVDKIKESFNDSVSWMQQQLGQLEETFNKGADQTAREFRKGISYLLDQAVSTRVQVEVRTFSAVPRARSCRATLSCWRVLRSTRCLQDATSTAESHLKATENTVLHHVRGSVKQGIAMAEDYPYAAYALAGAGLLAFPAPRAFVFRNVFGVLQSQVRC